MTRRALGTLSLVLFVAAAAVWVRARPSTPTFNAHPLAVIAATTTSTLPPTTTTTAPPAPAAPAVARAPAPPRAPLPPAAKPLTGPFWVAAANGTQIHVFSAPDGAHQTEVVSGGTEAGTLRVLLVKTRVNADWIEAYMPSRPNGHSGFVRTSEVTMSTIDTQVLVELRYHRLTAWVGDQMVMQEPVAIGTASSPTPTGLSYLAMLFKSPNPGGAYGPFVFGLATHSNVYEKFGGGDGMVGIHGTNQPGLIGRSVSHGCIRMYNASITKLVSMMPVGTPLVISG